MGNAGAGKTHAATQLLARKAGRDIARLSLDRIAWGPGTSRLPLAESLARLAAFVGAHRQWILEGCYGDLIEAALPHATELWFLNPGVETCVRNCLARPWEPEKFADPQQQAAMLPDLIAWVRRYESRTDEYGLARHRRIFAGFPGPKREFTEPPV